MINSILTMVIGIVNISLGFAIYCKEGTLFNVNTIVGTIVLFVGIYDFI